MLPEEIYSEINTLQNQINDHERDFDIALQTPHQLEQAKRIYKNIKVMEGRLAELQILLRRNTD
jgi:hypothetical protein